MMYADFLHSQLQFALNVDAVYPNQVVNVALVGVHLLPDFGFPVEHIVASELIK